MYKFTALAISVLISCGAHAEFYGGDDIAKWSDSLLRVKAKTADEKDYMNVSILRGVSIGIHDIFEGTAVCAPGNSTNGQIVDTVVLYVRNHPEKQNEGASKLAYKALSSAYPCNK